MNELNEKLAYWAGWELISPQRIDQFDEDPAIIYSAEYKIEYGDGTSLTTSALPNFTQSLDACFKWLVPKLWICNMTMEEGFTWSVSHPEYGNNTGPANEESALALCLAISKLIGQEVDNINE